MSSEIQNTTEIQQPSQTQTQGETQQQNETQERRQLTDTERAAYSRACQEAKQGQRKLMLALLEVKKNGWHEEEFPSFLAFLTDKLELGRAHAHRKHRQVGLWNDLSPDGETDPESLPTERQSREMGKISKYGAEELRRFWASFRALSEPERTLNKLIEMANARVSVLSASSEPARKNIKEIDQALKQRFDDAWSHISRLVQLDSKAVVKLLRERINSLKTVSSEGQPQQQTA